MDLFKQRNAKSKTINSPQTTRSEALRQQRLAHESTQKEAGKWGEMSVGTIKRDNHIFVHYWSGNALMSLSDLALKKSKELTEADHGALSQWLKTGRFEEFIQAHAAWNVSLPEAQRIKAELVEKHRATGLLVVNTIT